ncbi:DNA primase [Hymenobacter sp. H14-R3]|uniref:DNA primase n=1 Tax=Hymenobacter sp. H14-R3 TaxID=3046308 RepID=UPI0024B9037B|nr:DNA primase [Hymenobacter sp. H14-R3]MDJ0367303.1 DNA primase [Hymenobacter sp. H14-R3]
MLLSDSTIDQVRQLDILTVVEPYVKLKSRGHKHEACCPFHNENTPSFSVSPGKQIFKCFGCGAAGDGIGFVMKHQNLTFIEAVKEIAAAHSIVLDFEQLTPEAAAKAEEEQRQREAVLIALQYALSYFAGTPLPERWAETRKLKQPVQQAFQLGHAEQRKDGFYQDAIKNGYSAEVLVRAGLVRQVEQEGQEPKYYDFFQDRIMFPIRDVRGRVIAFTGRLITEPAPDAAYKPGKYVNSPDTVWVKGDHLYGLDLAADAIRKTKVAYLMEGNIDVMQFHQWGLANAVAPCGTALTDHQIKLLKRYTEHVVVVPDNDPAGMKALHKNAQHLIAAGFRVDVLLPEPGLDPDDMLKRKVKTQEELEAWQRKTAPYITGVLLDECEKDASLGGHDKAGAIGRLGEVLELIENDTLRQVYYGDVAERWPDFKRSYKLTKRGNDGLDKKALDNLGDNRADYFDFGFFEKNGCFYCFAKNLEVRICNFTFNIQYFVLSSNEPKYVCHFTNMFGTSRTMAVTTDDFTSVATFKKCVARLGNFIFEGNDEQLNMLKIKLFNGVAEAVQPRTMLYNPNGDFTTFANGLLYKDRFFPADRYGIVRLERAVATMEELAELRSEAHVGVGEDVHVLHSVEKLAKKVGDLEKLEALVEQGEITHQAHYFLPFASTLKLTDDDDDNYENERRFRLPTKVAAISFEDWSTLLAKAYGSNSMVMISFYLAAVFRDILYKANGNYFPLLHMYGLRGSGKSKAAEALISCFGQFSEETAVRLAGGATATGIQRYMSTARNSLMMLDEYKNYLPMPTIELLKGIANGTGKLMGRATGGNETKSLRPLSSAVVCGQDLPTKDPALLSRSVVLEFSEEMKRHNDRTSYEELRTFQESGATVHVTKEVLKYRDVMGTYRRREPDVTRRIRLYCQEQLGIEDPEDRTVQNAATLYCTTEILSEAGLKLPFALDDLFGKLMERIQEVIQIQHTSDDVEQYFMVLSSMIGRDIFEGRHFKLWKEDDGITKLFLRIRQVHPLYLQAAARQGVEPLSAATIRSYLTKSRFFLEDRTKGVRFKDEPNATSAMVFNYDRMREDGVELSTTEKLDEMIAEDDASRRIAHKVRLGDDAEQLVHAWLDAQASETTLAVSAALRQFNEDKEPGLSEPAFRAHLRQYVEVGTVHELEFSSDAQRFRLKTPF